jgi:outer membrane protein
MKKIPLSVALVLLASGYNAQADTLLGLYAGAQGWYMETSGGFSNNSTNLDFNFEDQTNASVYVALEHPIPLIPNVKLQRSTMDNAGGTTLTGNFAFGDELFAMNTNVTTDVQLSTTDVILYYEFFDNSLVSFDLGINAKYVDGDLLVLATDDPSQSAMESFSGPVPMVYSRVAVGLPFTGLGLYAEGSFLSIDDHSVTDYQVALTYSVLDNVAVDMTLQLGYRAFTLELDDLDDIYSDLEFKGAFAGLEVHF